jgi:hypothetical protein
LSLVIPTDENEADIGETLFHWLDWEQRKSSKNFENENVHDIIDI